MLARVFGVVETVFYLAIGIGSLLAPLLVETAGTRWALVAVGLFLPVVVLARARRIVGIDAEAVVPVHELELLGLVPMFAPLPQLSSSGGPQLVPVEAPRGRSSSSRATRRPVLRDRRGRGRRGRRRPTHRVARAGRGFGEIALLRDVPRTATVTPARPSSSTPSKRDAFLAAVTGHSASEEAADALIVSRHELDPKLDREPCPAAWFDELAELIAIPSVSADPSTPATCAGRPSGQDMIVSAGGTAELVETSRQPLVIGSGHPLGADQAPTVLCYCHFDVQPRRRSTCGNPIRSRSSSATAGSMRAESPTTRVSCTWCCLAVRWPRTAACR